MWETSKKSIVFEIVIDESIEMPITDGSHKVTKMIIIH